MSERLTFNYGTAAQAVLAQHLAAHEAAARPGGEPAKAVARPGIVSDDVTDWGYRGLILFTFMLFFRPQDHFPALASLHLAELSALLALGGMAVRRLRLHLPVAPPLPEVAGVVGLGVLIVATIPFSIWMGGAFAVFRDMYLKVLLIFILMLHALATPRRLEQFTWLILGACAYLSTRALLDYVRGVNLVEYGRVAGAVGGIFRNPNDLALNLVTFAPFALFAVALPGRSWRRVVAAGVAMVMIGAIVVTQSRSGAVGLGVVLALVALKLAAKKPVILGGAMIAIVLLVPLAPDSYWQRIASIGNERLDQTGSREARSTLMRESIEAFLARPFTGVGAGQFRNYDPEGRDEPWRESHNVLLQLAADLGMFGPLILLYLCWRGFSAAYRSRRLLREIKRHPERAAVLPTPAEMASLDLHVTAVAVALVGWIVCAQFASVAYNWTFYYVLALAVVPREILRARLVVRRQRVATAAPLTIAEARA